MAGAAVSTGLWATAALAEYRVSPGDVLELSIAGVADSSQRSTVELDGTVAFPLLGSISVAGLPLPKIRAMVEQIVPTKMVKQRAADGREIVFPVGPDDFLLKIAEYRPIYVDGDIAKPGEQPFRPSMTVRQAVAVAGGYDLTRFRTTDPNLVYIDLRGEYEVLWSEFGQVSARISRLETELNGKDATGSARTGQSPVAPDVEARISKLETDLFQTREADFRKEKEYLDNAIKQAGVRLSLLSDQQKKEEEGVRLDAADLEKVTGQLERGQGTILRVLDARRSLLLSSTRQLQTMAQAAETSLQRDELRRSFEKIDDTRRMEVVRELQSATLQLSSLKTRIQSAYDKMRYLGTVRSELTQGKEGQPRIAVLRKGEEGLERIAAEEDTELMPGDVVEVALKLPQLAAP